MNKQTRFDSSAAPADGAYSYAMKSLTFEYCGCCDDLIPAGVEHFFRGYRRSGKSLVAEHRCEECENGDEAFYAEDDDGDFFGDWQ